jgi:large subunit ribosomal protein L7e
MDAEKKVPPKPEGLRKKEERDAKIAAALKEQREKRREADKVKRSELLKRAQQYENDYKNHLKAETNAQREAKLSGQIYVPAQPKVAFVVRIRGINQLNPRVVRILRLLRLRQLHNGTFVRLNKASINLLRRVEPYITFG